MPIDQEELGQRLREAREASSMTQAQVAGELNVARSTVAEMEAGRRSVSGLELERLAYLFGKDLREFLSPRFDASDGLAVAFRAAPELARNDLARSLRDAVRLGRELSNLEALLGLGPPTLAGPLFPAEIPRNRLQARQQGEKAAQEERRRLDLGMAPVDDLAELLEGQGVRTAWIDLPDEVSGLTLRQREAGLFVVVNRRHPWIRRRFSWAHELAHVRLDADISGTVSRVDARDDLREIRANAFAATFLMPEAGVRQYVEELGKGEPSRSRTELFDGGEGGLAVEGRSAPGRQRLQMYDVVLVAHHFKVSRLAALYRLHNLKLLDRRELDDLLAQERAGLGRRTERLLGLERPDHQTLREEFRHRFLGLALDAYRLEHISRAKLVELAGLVGVEREPVEALLAEMGFHDEPVEARFPDP